MSAELPPGSSSDCSMDWDTYKRLCDRPDYWSRWMLLYSAALLEARGAAELGVRLRGALLGPCLAKPPGHRGPDATDMFLLRLTAREACAVCQQIEAAHAAQQDQPASEQGRQGVRQNVRKGVRQGIVVAWQDYLRSRKPQGGAC